MTQTNKRVKLPMLTQLLQQKHWDCAVAYKEIRKYIFSETVHVIDQSQEKGYGKTMDNFLKKYDYSNLDSWLVGQGGGFS